MRLDSMRRWLAALLVGAAAALQAQPVAAPASAAASAPAAQTPAVDLREQVLPLAVSVLNPYGLKVGGTIDITTFRPPGDGPFPLVVVSHGRAIADRRAQQGRQRFEPLARYLVSKGFAVFVPTRLGYGDTYGQADPEDGGLCDATRPEPASIAASDQVLATVELARTLPWVDASRWVAIGQSVGGLATVAVTWRNPPGLVAAINFSGGSGGNPLLRPGNPCSPQNIEKLWRDKAGASPVPMLWLYWQNDLYWGADWPQRWARAWQEGGGKLEFHQLPASGQDGHNGMGSDMDHWVPLVEAHLAGAGFTRSGLVPRPSASGFAAIDDLSRLPAGPIGRDLYRNRFLAATGPRAFAIGPNGRTGWAVGDWASGRALGFCQRSTGEICKLYAVDDEVVWRP